MSRKKDLRRKAVVEARVQWTLASRVILHFFIFICTGAVLGLINQFLADPFAGVRKNTLAFLQQSGPMLLALVCLIPVFVRDTLTLTNRIVGPIYRMRRTMRQLGDGEQDVPPLKFRNGDFWNDVPDLFNRMTDRLQNAGPEDESADGSPVNDCNTNSRATEQPELANA